MKKKYVLTKMSVIVVVGVSMLLNGCAATQTETENAAAAASAAVESSISEPAGAENTETGSTAAESTPEESPVAESTSAESAADESAAEEDTAETTGSAETKEDGTAGASALADEEREQYEDAGENSHAIAESGGTAAYEGIFVTKTGDADGDEADFYGTNAAVYAENGADVTIDDAKVSTNGTHANAVFSYGEGTTVTIRNATIETTGNCSGGIMVTGGGTLNAENLLIHTTGNSSAAIRSDRGGGTQVVTGGSYTTDGTGSPVIYSTADVTVSDAELTSTASQGVVVEGKNSVTLQDVVLTADNNTKNSDKSDYYQAVMIYQSMSGDAAEGEASFSMNGGSLTNKNGDIFFVNNTVATIDLEGASIINEDAEGVFLCAAAAGWGNEGSNGGHVTLTASGQEINGDMAVDDVSSLNLYLKQNSTMTGSVNVEGSDGEIYVEIEEGSTWVLTGDSHITSLTCADGAIDLNGYTLTVDGVAYEEGTASTGEAVEAEIAASSGQGGPGGDGTRPEAPPEGQGGPGGDGTRPEAPPEGQGGPGGNGEQPPAKPGE